MLFGLRYHLDFHLVAHLTVFVTFQTHITDKLCRLEWDEERNKCQEWKGLHDENEENEEEKEVRACFNLQIFKWELT